MMPHKKHKVDAGTYQKLIDLIEDQQSIINKQICTIKDLLNQCAEQENLISELMKDCLE